MKECSGNEILPVIGLPKFVELFFSWFNYSSSFVFVPVITSVILKLGV